MTRTKADFLEARQDLAREIRELVEVVHEVQDETVESQAAEAGDLPGHPVGIADCAEVASRSNLTLELPLAAATKGALVVLPAAAVPGVELPQVADSGGR